MPKRAKALTAVEVARLRDRGRHWAGGAEGLMLLVTNAGTRFWVCRVSVNGKRPDVRLGRYPEMSLSQARDAVHEVHRAIRDGHAPKAYLLPTTAKPVASPVEAVLDYATVMKWRKGDNPARWRGRLDKTLPAKAKVSRVRHHPALPFEEMPAFMPYRGGVGARAAPADFDRCALQ